MDVCSTTPAACHDERCLTHSTDKSQTKKSEWLQWNQLLWRIQQVFQSVETHGSAGVKLFCLTRARRHEKLHQIAANFSSESLLTFIQLDQLNPPHSFQPWVGLNQPVWGCVCECVCLRSPVRPAEVSSSSPRLLVAWDWAWVLIPGWMSLRWVMLCNLGPCSVWGLQVLETTQCCAATSSLCVWECPSLSFLGFELFV